MEFSIDPLLRCPLTKSSLKRLTADEVSTLNAEIAAGEAYHLEGTPVKSGIQGALLSEDGGFVYPIVDGIYILMPHLAIVVDEEPAKRYQPSLVQEKIEMVAFYDQLGWQQSEDQLFVDAARFEDLRPVTREYIQRCHLRLARYFAPSGDFLLDIASGPVQYPEYETYSKHYQYHICADISLVALQAARKKLGDHGIYLLCDITNIPLSDRVVDAFISLHTVYHVPAAEQVLAFSELQRVLKFGRAGVVVYSWGKQAMIMRFFTPWLNMLKNSRKGYAKLRKRVQGVSVPASQQAKKEDGDSRPDWPYFHAHTYGWVKKHLAPLGYTDMACWRSVSVAFLRNFIHPRLLGKQVLMVLFWLEGRCKRFFARFGQYPILICRK